MAGSLGPAVREVGNRRIGVIYGSGLLTGAILMALVLAAVGEAAGALHLAWLLRLFLAAALGLSVAQLLGFRPPQSPWQVPEPWRRLMSIDILAGLYGFLLGLGILNAVVLSAFWAFLLLSTLMQPPLVIAAWTVYALVRGLGFLALTAISPQGVGPPYLRRLLAAVAGVLALATAGWSQPFV